MSAFRTGRVVPPLSAGRTVQCFVTETCVSNVPVRQSSRNRFATFSALM
jgi:hypothetical protein